MKSADKILKPLVFKAQLHYKNGEKEKLQEANAEILELMKKFRYGLGRKFGNRGVEFDDIIQTLDLILIESVLNYDESIDPSPFRHLISRTRNNLWNYYRKEMNYFDSSKSTISYNAIFDMNYVWSNGEEQAEFKECDNLFIDSLILDEALSKLRPKQREVLELYFLEDKNTYEIAEILGINQSNVFRRIERGLSALKELLQDSQD